jgi:hypothetical protein
MMKSINFDIRTFFFYLFIFFSFIAEYKFLNSSVISYVIAIFFIFYDCNKIELNKLQIIFLLFFSFYFILLLYYSVDLVITLKNIKFFLGSIIIYLYLSLNKNKLNYIYIFRIAYSLIIIESFAVNTFIDQSLIYHTPHRAEFLNFYSRPPSFGGIASVTGAGLVILYYYLHVYLNKLRYFDSIFFLISLVLLFSTTAFAIFYIIIIGIFFTKENKCYSDYGYLLLIILLSIIFLLVLNYFTDQYLSDTFNFQKITITYFLKIVTMTFEKWNDFFVTNDFSVNYLLGRQVLGIISTSGDNGFLHLINQTGIIGIVIFFLFITIFTKNKQNYFFNLFLIILANFHYFTFGNIMCLIFIIQLMMHHEIKE